MEKIKFSFEHFSITRHLLRWTLLIMPVSVVVGLLVALFLWLLELATEIRWANMWLIFLLPLAGLLITFLYKAIGKKILMVVTTSSWMKFISQVVEFLYE